MKKEVLIIEDDDDIRYLLEYVLMKAQYEVRMGATAHDLNAALAAKRPDIIILDMMLPDGNGIDLCRELKADGQTRKIPVIIISAHQFSNTGSIGADDFISKPFSIKQVIAAVEKVS